MGELDGKVALVTGASAGIGRATAEAMAREGATVVLADVDDDRGAAAAAAVGGGAAYVHTDVADEAAVRSMVREVVERFGRLDVAVNNAGIEGEPSPIADCVTANWDRTIGVNLSGVFHCLRAEIPVMVESGGGSIVNISSIAGLQGFPGSAPYVASKHGVIGLTKTAALECATSGVRVNAVCPGVIATEMIDRFTAGNPEAESQLLRMEPLGRLGRAEEVADAVVWLCSERSSFVTGAAIVVDGGQQAG